ncbi:hypothetical protein EH206_17825 [Brenneria nigrifluens DSM 30175 = ATCC 13028]|uniref:Uncharacterized protein n=1 Tax=Brenneria nigrifluens DSM 30175 = ATCC 13028 TaxID=1121120 RepID=A0ABX5V361_9GAMM|nr:MULTISPECIES: hypothetical protein [Brenneria]QCR05875.1 hypothetical protein EH206_17825 [Brenneria nigrifluens DSM 30175 = ATCC 13028]
MFARLPVGAVMVFPGSGAFCRHARLGYKIGAGRFLNLMKKNANIARFLTFSSFERSVHLWLTGAADMSDSLLMVPDYRTGSLMMSRYAARFSRLSSSLRLSSFATMR